MKTVQCAEDIVGHSASSRPRPNTKRAGAPPERHGQYSQAVEWNEGAGVHKTKSSHSSSKGNAKAAWSLTHGTVVEEHCRSGCVEKDVPIDVGGLLLG